MSTKAIKITYWILTSIFVLAMLADSMGGLTQQQAGQDALKHLGYPMYFLIIGGVAKLLGALAILQTKFNAIKEWAYSGFVCTFIGASMSHYFVNDTIGMMIAPLIILAFTLLTYYFWKKYQSVTIQS
ncbi:MAG: DoxX family protein [Mucilaginibacter sp.]|uniref:DoxX family protein n=1 Tax=Mucilaginibacter sp. TaxID=1882438 RepID=UPI0032677BBF